YNNGFVFVHNNYNNVAKLNQEDHKVQTNPTHKLKLTRNENMRLCLSTSIHALV
ncbi:hypothetical protein KSS87_004678, partial [Heliosperma pusillum]